MTTKQDLDAKQAVTAYQQALAYAWGFQDAGGIDRDVSSEFARAFQARRVAFDSETRFFMPNLRDAFKQWMELGEIR